MEKEGRREKIFLFIYLFLTSHGLRGRELTDFASQKLIGTTNNFL